MAFVNSKFNGKKAAKLALMSTGAVLLLNTPGNATVLAQGDHNVYDQVINASENDNSLKPEIRNLSIDQPIQVAQNPCPTDNAHRLEEKEGYILVQCMDGIFSFMVVTPDETDSIGLSWDSISRSYQAFDGERTYVYQDGEFTIY